MNTRSRPAPLPERIDRYDVQRLLGKGAQGAVLLAKDSELDRLVALKLLRDSESPEIGKLASEAQIVSRLQHPNIITLYDVGRYGQLSYLVFEYIEGQTLQERIAAEGKLSLSECVITMSQVLAGVAYLHENRIVHRDLKPANILVSKSGIPKVLDFGISVLRDNLTDRENGYVGTLRYMSPESLGHEALGPAADVFSLASIFYELLTGQFLFDGNRAAEIIDRIKNGNAIELGDKPELCPPEIAKVLNCASQRDLKQRYATARDMKQALDAFRVNRNASTSEKAEQHATAQFLMRRMTVKKGFSALAGHVSEILEITGDNSLASADRLVNIIAKDPTLSQRVLTTANSAFYGNSEITTLARAIVLLGLDQIRMCITTVLLENEFESGSAGLREALVRAFHSAVVARSLAKSFGLKNSASAFTGAMFHDLGRLLTMHYFEEEYLAIQERAPENYGAELSVSRDILGLAYYELGMAVAKSWRFAADIRAAMAPLPRGQVEIGQSDEAAENAARLQVCSAFANSLTRIIASEYDDQLCLQSLTELCHQVSELAHLGAEDLDTVLGDCAPLTEQYARLVKLPAAKNSMVSRLAKFRLLRAAA